MMATQYPLLLLHEPAKHNKGRRSGRGQIIHKPSRSTQGSRIAPMYQRLSNAFEDRGVRFQFEPDGIEPELALVFEVAGTLKSFYGSVSRMEGFEWQFDRKDIFDPDENFYDEKHVVEPFAGRVYCVMSNKSALDQLFAAWNHYRADDNYDFGRNNASLRDLFILLKDVHPWGPSDRFEDTGIMDQWRESVEVSLNSKDTFEAELFYRDDEAKRNAASRSVRAATAAMNGRVISECVISDIGYHAMLLELPLDQIERLVTDQRDNLALAKCDAVMLYRPNGQMIIGSLGEIYQDQIVEKVRTDKPSGYPIIGMFDGMPLQNHAMLQGRLVIDDPDEYETAYTTAQRVHGTAMATLLAHGDLAATELTTLSRPIYVRPVMKPAPFNGEESFPKDALIVDLVHRAVRRMYEGEDGTPPTAPYVRVINISLGDRQRQYYNTPSALAKLVDWLSYKYNVLFVVSAGNEDLQLMPIEGGFELLKTLGLEERTKLIGKAQRDFQRNLRLLSPAESMNALTVGATYEDNASLIENDRAIQPIANGFLSPTSPLGGGIGRSIKPEIVYPGGRYLVGPHRWDSDRITITGGNRREPGIVTAAPPVTGMDLNSYAANAGSSYSAAAITHECALNYDVLQEIYANAGYGGVPEKYVSLLLKAMAVHGTTSSSMSDVAELQFQAKNQDGIQWVGFGKPDFKRVRECSENRVTAIGIGEIGNDQGKLFHIPLPINFSNIMTTRRLTVTLAYFSPAAFNRQEYRQARLWFDRVGQTEERLVPRREYTDYHAEIRGTLQHQTFIGSGAIPWNGEEDGIDLLISCTTTKPLSSLGKTLVPFALFTTFETKESIKIYQPVANSINIRVSATARSD